MAGAVGAGGIGNVAIAYGAILFENLFKPRQCRLAEGRVTDFGSLIYNLKAVL